VKTARWQTLLLVRLQWHRSLSRSGHCTPPLLALLRLAFASFLLVFVAFKLSFWAAPHDLEPDALDFVVGKWIYQFNGKTCPRDFNGETFSSARDNWRKGQGISWSDRSRATGSPHHAGPQVPRDAEPSAPEHFDPAPSIAPARTYDFRSDGNRSNHGLRLDPRRDSTDEPRLLPGRLGVAPGQWNSSSRPVRPMLELETNPWRIHQAVKPGQAKMISDAWERHERDRRLVSLSAKEVNEVYEEQWHRAMDHFQNEIFVTTLTVGDEKSFQSHAMSENRLISKNPDLVENDRFPKTFVTEVYTNTERVAQTARKRGHRVGASMSLESGWNFLRPLDRKAARAVLKRESPFFLVLAFPCSFWSVLLNLNPPKNDTKMYEEAITLLQFALQLAKDQKSRGCHFVLENPQSSRAWTLEEMQRALEQLEARCVVFHQCRFRLKNQALVVGMEKQFEADFKRPHNILAIEDGEEAEDETALPIDMNQSTSPFPEAVRAAFEQRRQSVSSAAPSASGESQASKRPAELDAERLREEALQPDPVAPTPAQPPDEVPDEASEALRVTHEVMEMEAYANVHPLRQIQIMAEQDRLNPLEARVRDHGTWRGNWPLPSRTEFRRRQMLKQLWPLGNDDAAQEVLAVLTARKEHAAARRMATLLGESAGAPGPGGLVLADDAAEMRAGQRDRWRMHEGRDGVAVTELQPGENCTPTCNDGLNITGSCTSLACPVSANDGAACRDDQSGPWWDWCGYGDVCLGGAWNLDSDQNTEHQEYNFGYFSCVDPSSSAICGALVDPPSGQATGPTDIEILDQGTIAVLAAIFVLAGIGVFFSLCCTGSCARVWFKPGEKQWSPANFSGIVAIILALVVMCILPLPYKSTGIAAGIATALTLVWSFFKLGAHDLLRMTREAAWRIHAFIGMLTLVVGIVHGIFATIQYGSLVVTEWHLLL
ncbi:Uncharacterized protein SCF082_LOCUS40715, partial [Durusdinium trenchii]